MTSTQASTTTPGSRVWGVLSRVISWSVIIAVSAAILAAVVIPRLGGATPYTILTSSMRPQYPPGTLMVMRPTKVSALSVGDVITYQLRSGEPTVVTHRIIEIRQGLTGKTTFITQGDNNPIPDPTPVKAVQIRGSLWYHVPHLGRANALLTGGQRHLATVAVAVALLVYAVAMFVSALRERRRRQHEDAPSVTDDEASDVADQEVGTR